MNANTLHVVIVVAHRHLGQPVLEIDCHHLPRRDLYDRDRNARGDRGVTIWSTSAGVQARRQGGLGWVPINPRKNSLRSGAGSAACGRIQTWIVQLHARLHRGDVVLAFAIRAQGNEISPCLGAKETASQNGGQHCGKGVVASVHGFRSSGFHRGTLRKSTSQASTSRCLIRQTEVSQGKSFGYPPLTWPSPVCQCASPDAIEENTHPGLFLMR